MKRVDDRCPFLIGSVRFDQCAIVQYDLENDSYGVHARNQRIVAEKLIREVAIVISRWDFFTSTPQK